MLKLGKVYGAIILSILSLCCNHNSKDLDYDVLDSVRQQYYENPEQIKKLTNEFIELYPNESIVYAVMSEYYLAENKLDSAIILINKALAIDSLDVLAIYNLGDFYEQLNNPSQARKYYNRVVNLDSNYFMAHYSLMSLDFKLKDYKNTLKHAHKAISIQNSEGFLGVLSVCYYYTGDSTKFDSCMNIIKTKDLSEYERLVESYISE